MQQEGCWRQEGEQVHPNPAGLPADPAAVPVLQLPAHQAECQMWCLSDHETLREASWYFYSMPCIAGSPISQAAAQMAHSTVHSRHACAVAMHDTSHVLASLAVSVLLVPRTTLHYWKKTIMLLIHVGICR